MMNSNLASRIPPFALRGMGSLHVGGELITMQGLPSRQQMLAAGGTPVTLDPNGQYAIGQMYAQYFLVEQPRSETPLMLWHGGGLTGACWETTPDGRAGWLHQLLAQQWDVYLCDAAERGRSGFAPVPEYWPTPISQTASDVFNRFRFGQAPAGCVVDALAQYAYPGQQFPVDAFATFFRQLVPRWAHTDDVIARAYAALLDRVGETAIICHSQGGVFGLTTAITNPERVKAVVALEPAAVPMEALEQHGLTVPVLIVLGDHMDRDARWPQMRKRVMAFAERSSMIDVIDLPALGIKGNSHMLMMDANSDVVLQHVQAWLAGKLGV